MKWSVKKLISKTWFQIIIISLIIFLVFFNVFQNEFVGDDIDFLIKWEEIKDLKNIGKILKGNTPVGHEEVYRPVRGLIYLVEYHFFGDNEFFYHLQAILIHITVTILIYLLIRKVVGKNQIAFFVSLLFGIHPIHTEMITFVAGSMDSFAFIFYFLSFLFYLKTKEKRKISLPDSYQASLFVKRVENLYFIASLILAFLAFATYEVTVTLPIMIVLYEIIFGKLEKKNWKEKIEFILPFFLVLIFYFCLRFFVVHIIERNTYQAGSFFQTMLVNVLVIIKYLRLNLAPFGLALNHKIAEGIYAHTFPKYNWEAISNLSIFDLRIFGGIILLGSILWWVWKNWKKEKELSFGIVWFFVGFLPVLNIIPHASLLAERYSYIPSLGICIILAVIVKKIWGKRKWLGNLMIIILLGSFGFLTYKRNFDWKNEVSLWEVDYKKTPENSMVTYKLGSAYRDRGDIEMAKKYYHKTLVLNPDFIEAYNNLGVILEQEGDWEKAKEYYLRALSYNPEVLEVLNNLGILERKYGDKQKAIEYYKKALEIAPENEVSKFNLLEVYLALSKDAIERQDLVTALEYFMKAFKIDQNNFEIANNIGSVYARQEKYKNAIEWYQKALELNPDFKEARNNLEKAERLRI